MARETSGGAGARENPPAAGRASDRRANVRRRARARAHAYAALVGAFVALLPARAAAATASNDAPRFRHLGLENGLSHSSVYTVLQDRQGFLWFGTQAGLDRYDGYRILRGGRHTDEPHLLPNRDFGSVYEDAAGALWLGSWGGGLYRYDPRGGTLRSYRHDAADPLSLSDGRIHTITQDAAGTLWVATFRGLDRVDPSTLAIEPWKPRGSAAPPLDGLRVWSLATLPDGRLWVGTGQGLYLIDPATGVVAVQRHASNDAGSLPSDEVRGVLVDRAGQLWVATGAGLAVRPPGEARFRTVQLDTQAENGNAVVDALYQDSRGGLWVGTLRGGLYHPRDTAHPETLERFHHDPLDPGSIAADDVRCITEDDSGLLWIGTRGGGVSILDPRPVRFHRQLDELVEGLHVDRTGATWAGGLAGLVRIDVDGTSRRLVHRDDDPRSLPNDTVQAVLEDRDGLLWVGTFAGLATLDRASERFSPVPGPGGVLASQPVQALRQAPDGAIWVGTRSAGVFRRDAAGKWTNLSVASGQLSDDYVRFLYFDRAGNAWVGTDVGGLDRVDRAGRLQVFRHSAADPGSLPDDRVHAVWEADDGTLWVGTGFGLARLRPHATRFINLFEDDGLPSSAILGILGDRAGFVWLASNGGLSRLDPVSGEVHTFGANDGVQGPIFTSGSAFATRDGELLFGGRRGLNRFRAETIVPNPHRPPIVLTDFQVLGKRPANLGAPVEAISRIELTHRDSFFTLEVAALDFVDPERNRYSYKLDGFDLGWVELGERHVIAYTRVEPGEYTLRVRAANSDGLWNEQGLAIPFVVTPPFWATWWFRTLAMLLVGAALVGGHHARLRVERRRNAELERLVAERTREAVARRQEAETQRRRLALTNDLVKIINEETEFGDLLRAILEGVTFFVAGERGLALVVDAEGRFRSAASAGWVGGTPPEVDCTREEIEKQYLALGRELAPGVIVGPASASTLRDLEQQHGGPSAAALALRIEVEGEVAGYVLISHVRDPRAFTDLDVSAVLDLTEHVDSAFLKGRVLARLRNANEKKSEFLGIAAHDLRSPLGGILSTTDLLLRLLGEGKVDNKVWQRFLGNVRFAAEQMRTLVSDLLDVTSIESGRVRVDFRQHRLRDLVDEWLPLHQRIAEDKGVRLVVDEPPPELVVMADRARVGEIVDNLLSNAIKFTASGREVRISCVPNSHEVSVLVRDEGPGFSTEELPRAFDGGRLSARPTAGETSSGLGLVIVKKLVELQGGRVWVESQPGAGSTVGFTLPIAS